MALDEQLEQDLERLTQDDTFADAVLKGTDGQVAVHLAILDVRCPSLAGEPEDYQLDSAGADERAIIPVKATKSTLVNFVFFVYTDKLKEGLTSAEAMSLMALASELSKGSAEEGLPVHRLYALCEQLVHTQLDQSNAVEVLVRALSHEFLFLEQSVYEFLARERPSDVDFCGRFVDVMRPDHLDKLKYAMAAMVGNSNPKAAAKASACEVPQPRLLGDLRTLLCHAKDTKWPDARQRFVDGGVAVEGKAGVFGAHRFIFALRSEFFAAAFRSDLKEGKSRLVRLSTKPGPSPLALGAFYSFIYTGNWQIDGAEKTDYFDLLCMLGDNYMVLSGCEDLRSAVSQHVLSQGSTGNPWQLLRRATASCNEEVKARAKQWVLHDYFRLRHDAAELKASCAAPTEEECPWWTGNDEAEMLKDVLCSVGGMRSCTDVDWSLTVENGWPEGQYNVWNQCGNGYLKSRGGCGSGTHYQGQGVIRATFPETVCVSSIVIAPLSGWGPGFLRNAVLQVKLETGEWTTICDTLTGDEQRITVESFAKEWQLIGTYIATSLFLFES